MTRACTLKVRAPAPSGNWRQESHNSSRNKARAASGYEAKRHVRREATKKRGTCDEWQHSNEARAASGNKTKRHVRRKKKNAA